MRRIAGILAQNSNISILHMYFGSECLWMKLFKQDHIEVIQTRANFLLNFCIRTLKLWTCSHFKIHI